MFRCNFCTFRTCQLKSHLQHRLLHSNLSNKFWCGFRGCLKSFRLVGSLISHVRRKHRQKSTRVPFRPLQHTEVTADANSKFVCSITLCKKECDNRHTLIKHLKSHIRTDQTVQCPYEGCKHTYKQLNSFTGHLSKKHKSAREVSAAHMPDDRNLTDTETTVSLENNCVIERAARVDIDDIIEDDEPDMNDDEPDMNEDEQDNVTESFDSTDPFLRKLSQSYLKLECQLLVPSSTIQHIVSESCSTHDISQNVVKNNLRSRLIDEGIAMDKVDAILDDVFDHDPFVRGVDTLKTIYKRKKYYKKTFAYIEPIEVLLDENENGKKWFHYVPVEQTLIQLFSDKSLASELNRVSEVTDPDILSDITDGTVFQQSSFFKENPDGLKLILYQDGFEVVNPIGSAVQKYKILAVYMSIGNLTEHARSHVNSIKLVALCKEKEFNHSKVYGRITEDLKK